MKKSKQRLAELAKSMGMAPNAEQMDTQLAVETSRKPTRGSLTQMTVKLDPTVRGRLLQESMRRKRACLANWQLQTIITEAVNAYLGKRQDV